LHIYSQLQVYVSRHTYSRELHVYAWWVWV